ncbi:hypothetical protein A1C_04280 [Rickettsia akari str. Hartford]|uniref:Uncharacterized protein n=1 Tax=Rickettsia akari (strain Hartford) TaxID=293614 RepID=A8GP03_RICAH|nr:hypothetical protein A1C_04280 [Rickettsia akari str. Hartford]
MWTTNFSTIILSIVVVAMQATAMGYYYALLA